MKTFVSQVKNLSQKAAEIKAAMQQLPPKVAEVREAVAATATQLQQLRTDVQSSVADLKADNEHRISHALQEINGSLDVFVEAGFEVSGVDLELSPVQRLLIHLNRLEDVPPAVLQSLIAANQHRKTTNALLTSLLQARQMADTVQMTNLDFCELIVGLGPIPSVRLCWRAELVSPESQPAHTSHPILAPSPAAATPVVEPSPFSQSSFFERREPRPMPALGGTLSIPPSAPSASLASEAARSIPEPESVQLPGAEAAKSDPLARFKKMPDLSKLRK